MNDVIYAMWQATKSQFNYKMMALVFTPFLISIVFWSVITYFYWSDWHQSMMLWMNDLTPSSWFSRGMVSVASGYFISLLILFMLAPAVYLSTLLITAFFSMPIIVEHVHYRDFRDLSPRGNSYFVKSLMNSFIAIGVLLVGWILGFPLWLLTPLSPLISLLLTAYFIQRLFRYDALSTYASDEELHQIVKGSLHKFFLLGIIAGLLQFIPIVNLFGATWVGLAYTYLALGELRDLRYTTAI
ncbi:MAG: hypothetical protein B7Z60_07435 [Ferrovum sp. 37-45-19]|nr:MAG: hypothetical protein B7Z65_07615 [Ferrovum sp. 21-44-67]OYV93720.1 MAG: hypothetical protein B7Z60_07435 [Ferrovum sp. 37-45-19]OZB32253.1 MAG: hypothetical protein B7X47_06780 [Ferrovum sp. 34-44-207]HQT81326.1 EI24 domain-containing protein [Ferrovaceae bacterium]HQU06214.1 EI24 domain-containing protein [Ferrovaceae bacterium]